MSVMELGFIVSACVCGFEAIWFTLEWTFHWDPDRSWEL